MRTWEMFGYPAENGVWYALGDHWYVHIHGCKEPVPVVVTEDPDGDHLGWIETGMTTPEMIQHKRVFEIQFTYGSPVEVERGYGEVVPLRVELSEA